MKTLSWTFGLINALAAVLILLITAIFAPAFALPFYEREYEKNGVYEQISIDKDELKKVTSHMVDYLQGEKEKLSIDAVVANASRPFFNETEIFHMEDVKDLFEFASILRYVMFALFVISLFIVVRNRSDWKRIVFSCWKYTALTVFALLLALGIGAFLNFDYIFTTFHEIFFSNDLWQLDPVRDLLINIVPLQFFIDISIYIGVFFTLGLALMFIAGSVFSKKAKGGGVY